jgi:hypothetical protein
LCHSRIKSIPLQIQCNARSRRKQGGKKSVGTDTAEYKKDTTLASEMKCSDTRIGDPGRPGLLSLSVASDEGVPTQHEENVRQQILEGLIAAKGGGLSPLRTAAYFGQTIAKFPRAALEGGVQHSSQFLHDEPNKS